MLIEHVVIIVKENHTFDNYFGTFPAANGAALGPAANPPAADAPHDHLSWMKRASDTAHRVQYGEKDIPSYFSYARDFTLCDNYFSEVAGPSTPNHLMLICADAPIINNPSHHYNPKPADAYNLASLPTQLAKAGKTWANYGGYAFHFVKELASSKHNHTRDLFLHDAEAGQLPSVSWLYADGRPSLTEHPTQNVTDGMQWTGEQVNAIVAGGLWSKTAIFITWDDWGGWSDHVTPSVVETWSPAKSQRAPDAHPEFDGQPFRYGSRVPCLVVSPYAKAGHISKELNSHVSLVKFCQTLFGLPHLNTRDGGSNGMADCFDFKQKPLSAPKP
ncbi:MAG: hypothetical protein CV088_01050 [Nitrospira sp. LK70]|nr:hypothetical protein [Nitrospira sp. LK70]